MNNKRYSSVSEMLHDLSGNSQFNQQFDERLAQRRLVKHLIALRSAKGVSQADVANVLAVTQSKVSKIESGIDDDLRFSELKGYAQALGMDIGIIFSDPKRTIVDELKFYVFRIKHALDQLADPNHSPPPPRTAPARGRC
jgi:transcriptional regulator with XRE-family HTH domain